MNKRKNKEVVKTRRERFLLRKKKSLKKQPELQITSNTKKKKAWKRPPEMYVSLGYGFRARAWRNV